MYYPFSEHIHVFASIEHDFSYLSYLITGEHNILIGTVPEQAAAAFLAELQAVIPLPRLDAVILGYSEEAQSGALSLLLKSVPSLPIYCTPDCQTRLMGRFPHADFRPMDSDAHLSIGEHRFQFTHTPGLHWDDNMVTYYENESILFSNDLFSQYAGVEPPLDTECPVDELVSKAADYFHKVLSSATAEQKQALFGLVPSDLACVAPGHGVILQDTLDDVLDFYEMACQ